MQFGRHMPASPRSPWLRYWLLYPVSTTKGLEFLIWQW